MRRVLQDEMRMIAEAVGRYVADHNASAVSGADEQWQEFAELGWLSLPYAEGVGGLGLGTAGVSVVMEGHGKGLLRTPYVPFAVMAGGVMARCPDGVGRLDALMSGELRVSPAFVTAGTHTETGAPKAVARKHGEGFRLSGANIHAQALAAADAILVPALIEGSAEIGLFLVPLKLAGVTSSEHEFVDGRSAGYVSLTDVWVPPSDRIDAGIDAGAVLDVVRDEALIAASAENLGAMQALYDQTLEYAKLRKQFGYPIGSFQSLQFRLVDMWIKLDEARSLVAAAAAAEDRSEVAALAAAAWIQVVWSGRLIREEAIQIHGAIAMTEEYAVGRYVKRILVNELLFGSPERHLARYRTMASN